MRGIFEAVNYLHEMGIAHRDLKPANLVFLSNDDDSVLKIIDFGFAKNIKTDGILTSPLGTAGYSSIEILDAENYSKPYTMSVDLFALGCVMFCVMFADPPFVSGHDDREERDKELDHKVEEGVYIFPKNIPVSDEAIDFLNKSLAKFPEARVTATQALRHEWWTNDWPISRNYLPKDEERRTSLDDANWVRYNFNRPIDAMRKRNDRRAREVYGSHHHHHHHDHRETMKLQLQQKKITKR